MNKSHLQDMLLIMEEYKQSGKVVTSNEALYESLKGMCNDLTFEIMLINKEPTQDATTVTRILKGQEYNVTTAFGTPHDLKGSTLYIQGYGKVFWDDLATFTVKEETPPPNIHCKGYRWWEVQAKKHKRKGGKK